MNPVDYEYLSNFLLQRSGLSLGAGKEYLLEARLIPLAQSLGFNDIHELVNGLRLGKDKRIEFAVTEAMTTNETSFFRDKKPFDEITSLISGMIESRSSIKRLRIWCAAASTGQEPYSLTMHLYDQFPFLTNWMFEIVGTDISEKALETAKNGIYTQFEVQRGLPVQKLMSCFDQVESGWKIKDRLQKPIKYQQLNLLEDFMHLGQFDLILCRNVLIYFRNETKADIVNRFRKQIASDGFLLLGAAETMLGVSDEFERLREFDSALYRPAVNEPAKK
jgi:chemotaxis protein methyltransferase CheR